MNLYILINKNNLANNLIKELKHIKKILKCIEIYF